MNPIFRIVVPKDRDTSRKAGIGPSAGASRKLVSGCILSGLVVLASCSESWPPSLQQTSSDAPVLSPEEALETFFLPPGYRMELVASEPLVQTPVAIDFDADGRLWVVEMRGYMRDVDGSGEQEPSGRIVVLDDLDGDGRMDTSTVYMDKLLLPRAVKVLTDSVLVGAPPNLWLTRDTTGDFVADQIEIFRDDFGSLGSNPEFNANGLLWGMDNWIHSAHYAGLFKYSNGELVYAPGVNVGQWGIAMDDYGRIYRNYNYEPLGVDLLPSYYFTRNPSLTRTSGLYDRAYRRNVVWPVRPTPGVNQGYMDGILRDDQTLINYTSASGPAVYRGDRLPSELKGNVFVPEPAANLVQRLVMKLDDDGRLRGENPYHADQAEFLTSTDERFRPVHVYTAPDGTLYVVDMYQGIIQHRSYMSDYMRGYIAASGLNEPTELGRIYRIVHESTVLEGKPSLSMTSSEELVTLLEHPNGWWRDTAQRLIVERGDRSVAPALRTTARDADPDYVRMHALWSLSGLDAVDEQTLLHSLQDASPYVRAAAIRVAEPWLEDPAHPVSLALFALMNDAHPVVLRQLAASLGSLPPVERVQQLARIVAAHGGDPIVVDAALGGLHGLEADFLERFVADETFASSDHGAENAALAVAAIFYGSTDADIFRLLEHVASPSVSLDERFAVLAGIETAISYVYLIRAEHSPDTVLDMMETMQNVELKARLQRVLTQVVWPGKSDPRLEYEVTEPLTEEEVERYSEGDESYSFMCAPCHGPAGLGLEGAGSRLVGSEWVVGPASQLAQLLLHGLQDESLMPRLSSLTDEQLASIMTYIRQSWGHMSSPVPPEDVSAARALYPDRTRPWTPEELRSLPE